MDETIRSPNIGTLKHLYLLRKKYPKVDEKFTTTRSPKVSLCVESPRDVPGRPSSDSETRTLCFGEC